MTSQQIADQINELKKKDIEKETSDRNNTKRVQRVDGALQFTHPVPSNFYSEAEELLLLGPVAWINYIWTRTEPVTSTMIDVYKLNQENAEKFADIFIKLTNNDEEYEVYLKKQVKTILSLDDTHSFLNNSISSLSGKHKTMEALFVIAMNKYPKPLTEELIKYEMNRQIIGGRKSKKRKSKKSKKRKRSIRKRSSKKRR